MKNKRQQRILELIKEHSVDTQEMLQGLLAESGFDVTQATVSRDIKEMKLIKKHIRHGVYRYAAPQQSSSLDSIFIDTVTDIDHALNTVVIKCGNGMAQAACAALDKMGVENIVGTIAGDDTIFALMRTEKDASDLVRRFRKLVGGQ